MQKLPDASTLTPEELIERWKLWMKGTQEEAFRLYWSRFLFENLQGMYRSNKKLAETESGDRLYKWLLRFYFTDFLITIRKEMECGGGFLTLGNFLIELENHSEVVLTRQRYVALYKQPGLNEYGIPDKQFDDKPGAASKWPRSKNDDFISRDVIRETRERLDRDTKRVVKYASWFIAHRTRQKPIKLTLVDMYKSLNRIFDTYATYYGIITGGTWMNKFPTPQYDWEAPFTFSWITDEFKEWKPPE